MGRLDLVIKKSGMSLTKFSKKSGVSAGYLSDILKGKKTPSDRVITDICNKNSLSENWLRTGNGEMLLSKKENEKNLIT